MSDQLQELLAENEKLKAWISDLQSGMFINCVYCGHRYGPKDQMPATLVAADPVKIKAVQDKISHLPKTIELKNYRRVFAEIYLGRPATDKEVTMSGDAMTDTWIGDHIFLNDLKTWVPLYCAEFQRRLNALGGMPPTMAETLKEHIKVCPKHPLSKCVTTLTSLGQWTDDMCSWKDCGVRLRAMCEGTLDSL